VTVKIPYKEFPSAVGVHHAAVLSVQLALPGKNAPRTKRFEAFIDSGASRCVFHASIGDYLGLNLRSGEIEATMGVSGTATSLYLHNVLLYIPGGPVQVRAGFAEDLPVAGLLGMEGFFEHLRVTFDPVAKACELVRLFNA